VSLVRQKAAGLVKDDINRIISDGAPGTGCPVIASLTGVDYALVVTEPTVSGIHDLRRILDVTRHFGVKSGVVVNKYDLNLEITEQIKSLAGEYEFNFLGVIPYDKNVTLAQMKKQSLIEYGQGKALKNIEQIWDSVVSEA
jgi:MinD superfamily P-loop ATPase